ncbi:MAG: hypothetical protein P8Q97_04305 [Myxococcota bacterium]|nr:hypothetical protein [Myxococcota bacterium]
MHTNTGFGLRLSTETGYRENIITNNTAGTVTGGLGYQNVCNGNTTCP